MDPTLRLYMGGAVGAAIVLLIIWWLDQHHDPCDTFDTKTTSFKRRILDHERKQRDS